MKVILILIAFLTTSIVFSQKRSPEYYDYPFSESYEPLTVMANIVLLQRKDGSGNFDMNNSEQKQLLSDYLENVNKVYSNFKQPDDLTGCYTGTDFFSDAKIRMKYNIMQVRNEFAWNYLNSGANPEQKIYSGFSPSESWYIKPLDDSIVALNLPKAINIYFTQNGERFDDLVKTKGKNYDVSTNAASQLPTDRNLKRSSQTHQPNRFLKYITHKYQAPIEYNTTWEQTRNWHINDAKGFAHELGHSFGLAHSSEYYSTNRCKYSLMSQKGADPRNWLPPTEIKKIHWNLTRTNLMQFVTPESYYGLNAIWYINQDTEWNKPRRFYHNFEIAQGVTLTISDSVILAPQSTIKLNKESKIIFKGKGQLTNAYGEPYKNFNKHRRAEIIRQ